MPFYTYEAKCFLRLFCVALYCSLLGVKQSRNLSIPPCNGHWCYFAILCPLYLQHNLTYSCTAKAAWPIFSTNRQLWSTPTVHRQSIRILTTFCESASEFCVENCAMTKINFLVKSWRQPHCLLKLSDTVVVIQNTEAPLFAIFTAFERCCKRTKWISLQRI